MGRLANMCRWSSSREALFRECPKKYWYSYYGAWEGWPKTSFDTRPSLSPLAQYLYLLKNMQSAAMYMGTVVHATIAKFLSSAQETRQLPSQEEMTAHVRTLWNTGVMDARNQRWKEHPKQHVNLFEVFYDQPFNAEALEEKAVACLGNWLDSPCIKSVAFHPKACWKGIEASHTFSVAEGIEAVVVFDFIIDWIVEGQRQKTIIFDWKTGQESDKITGQMSAYALAAHMLFSHNVESLMAVPFFLQQGPLGYKKIGNAPPFQETELQAIKAAIITATQAMLSVHATAAQAPEQFPYTSCRYMCKRCNFQTLCHQASYQELSYEALTGYVP